MWVWNVVLDLFQCSVTCSLGKTTPPLLFITVRARQHCIEIPPLFTFFFYK